MIGLQRGMVALVPYDSAWVSEYEKEAENLKRILGDLVVGVEHIGSTAVPGLMAKPVIDLMVGILTMADAQKCIELFEKAGYHWRPKFGDIARHIVIAKGDELTRTHYIHVVEYDGKDWKDKIVFRDALRSNEELKKKYEELKVLSAQEHEADRKMYTKQKDEFVESVLKEYNRGL